MNQLPATFTGSLKVSATFAPTATSRRRRSPARSSAPRAPGRRPRGHGDVVDADPLVVADRVRGDDPDLHDRLVVDRGRERDVHGRDERREARPGGGVGHEAGRHVRVAAGRADAVLERDRLDGVVGRAVDVAQGVGDRDVGEPGRVDGEEEVRRVGGARALECDDGIGGPSNSATPPFAITVLGWFAITSTSFATRESVRSVCGSVPVASVMSWPRKPTTPGTPVQLVVRRDQAGVAPVLREREQLGRRVRRRGQRADEQHQSCTHGCRTAMSPSRLRVAAINRSIVSSSCRCSGRGPPTDPNSAGNAGSRGAQLRHTFFTGVTCGGVARTNLD